MNPSWIDVFKFIVIPLIPILIYKSRTRSEVVLKQKSPFIIDLFVSLNKLHAKVLKFSSVISTQGREKDEIEFLTGLDVLIDEITDNQAKAKLYLHESTNKDIEEFVKTAFEVISSRRMHEYMLANRISFTANQINDEYRKWSEILPNKLKILFENNLTPSLRIELNGQWDSMWLSQNLFH